MIRKLLLFFCLLFFSLKSYSFQTPEPVFNEDLPEDLTLSCSDSIPAAPTLTATAFCGNNDLSFCGEFINVNSLDPGIFIAEIYLGEATGTFGLNYITGNIPDRVLVEYDGTVYDSKYKGNNLSTPFYVSDLLSYDGSSFQVFNYEDVGGGNYEFVGQGYTQEIEIDASVIDVSGEDSGSLMFEKEPGGPDYMTVTCISPLIKTVLSYQIVCNQDADNEGGSQESNEVEVSFEETIIEGDCPNNYVIERTWTATDACGNSITHTQTISVKDNEAPVFENPLPEDLTLSCSETIPEAQQLLATDTCGEFEVSVAEQTIPGDCPNNYVIERIWTATDSCGNTATHQQTISVEDNEAPVFENPLPEDLTLSCSETIPEAQQLSATDTCGEVEVNLAEQTVLGDCSNNYIIERVWTATDACGNTATHQQTISVEDNEAPIFEQPLPEDLTLSCSETIPEAQQLSATDTCEEVEVNLAEQTIPGDCPNNFVIELTWTATDTCGNSTTHTQTISVEDNEAPVIVHEGIDTQLSVMCEDLNDQTVPELSVTDNCDDVELSYSQEKIDGGCAGNYTLKRTWEAVDACGNFTQFVQDIAVTCTELEMGHGISPNGDGRNDNFIIKGITCFPDNRVKIFNRYGTLVYEAAHYDNDTVIFEGYPKVGSRYNGYKRLPVGTYYYVVDYNYISANRTQEHKRYKDWLYLVY